MCWESFALQWVPHTPALSCAVAPFLLCGYLVVGFSPSWLLFQDGPNRTGTTRALDCGAGIGRITKRLLLPLFKTVDMVDVTEDFLTKAKSYLGEEGRRVRNYFCCGLQDFSPEANSYDVIWIQWVIGEGHSACGGLTSLSSVQLLLRGRCPMRWGELWAGELEVCVKDEHHSMGGRLGWGPALRGHYKGNCTMGSFSPSRRRSGQRCGLDGVG